MERKKRINSTTTKVINALEELKGVLVFSEIERQTESKALANKVRRILYIESDEAVRIEGFLNDVVDKLHLAGFHGNGPSQLKAVANKQQLENV